MTGPHTALIQMLALAPLVLFYELAMPFTTLRSGWYHRIDAWSQAALAKIGLTAYYLPGLVILATLLVIHIWRRDAWKLSGQAVLKLWGEALLWTVPLVVLYLLFTLPVQKLLGVLGLFVQGPADLLSNVVLAVGAGLFEEFVFRLLLVSLILLLLQKLFNSPLSAAQVTAVLVSAAAFSAMHHIGPGHPPYSHVLFLFRVGAGIYLGSVYIGRGFATAAIVHTAFNVIVFALPALR